MALQDEQGYVCHFLVPVRVLANTHLALKHIFNVL